MTDPDDRPGAADPLALLRTWWDEARQRGAGVPDALSLATVTPAGEPANRVVVVKGIDAAGIVLVTSERSPKGRDLAQHPVAAGVLLWPEPLRQVRVTGPVAMLDDAASADLFAAHTRLSQAGFVVSAQGEPIDPAGLADLRDRIAALADAPGDLQRPAPWHGYRLRPTTIEFWSHDPGRAHPRWRYTRPTPDGPWTAGMVQP
ncbi:pyridoxine/pyridoxamine 5'-phosphate oxidase [Tersicoccus solisilvae]|uniref:Pyridoxine/pyridoxamine 5'-phosphate oxidase n=1 Tax=Tersicoccus solisilvae TaxID=1882339 RepID=A0ABQ1PQ27_9MICC|nr:pyridoxal 5'-phosphate synthase [Tersicoccus solisilvae]GGD00947.1 pyridoxine/pyridoxamine 5'-phosphate oxidase [Tersicoccus solisilvae]